jgi:hypothetical protein
LSTNSYCQAVDQLEAFAATEGPFDGLLAFSQGATIAGTLLAKKYLNREPMSTVTRLTSFKCAIFFSALQPVDYDALVQGNVRALDASVDGAFLKIPTVHVWGSKDSIWSDGSKALSNVCIASIREIYVHDGGHEIPGPRSSGSVTEIVKAIRRMVDRASRSQY